MSHKVPWFLYKMVTQNILRKCEGNHYISEEKCQIVTVPDLNKCLKQIKLPISLYTCAPISVLPSDLSAMLGSVLTLRLHIIYFSYY